MTEEDLADRVDALELAVKALANHEFSDYEGHPFRGNQWTSGGGAAGPDNPDARARYMLDPSQRNADAQARGYPAGDIGTSSVRDSAIHDRQVRVGDRVAALAFRAAHADKSFTVADKIDEAASLAHRFDADPSAYRDFNATPGDYVGKAGEAMFATARASARASGDPIATHIEEITSLAHHRDAQRP